MPRFLTGSMVVVFKKAVMSMHLRVWP
jgi:hypothetical protein